MNLTLDPLVAEGLKSQSQVARRVTEAWAADNLFCLACPSEELVSERHNAPVRDFTCPRCQTTYQLKGKNGQHTNVVANSAYAPKIAAIRQGTAPNYVFLDYNRDTWKVTGLFVVPGHFVTEAVIQRRPPLRPSARRSGWVGSKILLSRLPPEGRIALVSDGSPVAPQIVRANWSKFQFLKTDTRALGGWGADVLNAVRRLQELTSLDTFTLQSFYARFEETLAQQHPDNLHVQAKIRQQLQVLRDGGVLQFLGHGRYRVVG